MDNNITTYKKEVLSSNISSIDEKLTKANLEEANKERVVITAEELDTKSRERDIYRRSMIFPIFKDLTNREMTEEEYKRYIKVFEDPETKTGYNIVEFIYNLNEAEKKKHKEKDEYEDYLIEFRNRYGDLSSTGNDASTGNKTPLEQ